MTNFGRDIPENVRRFIGSHIDSVVSLEVLVLLYHQPQREWAPEEVAGELRVDPGWTEARLKSLVRDGLACTSADNKLYRYYPATMPLNATVAALASTYAERPLTVISFIYSRPGVATLLADAFRLRR